MSTKESVSETGASATAAAAAGCTSANGKRVHAADELDAAPAAKKGKAATAALTFTTPLGSGLVLTEDDTVATGTDKKAEAGRYCGYMDSFAAVCPIVMQAGMHYAEIKLLDGCPDQDTGFGCPMTFGVVGADFPSGDKWRTPAFHHRSSAMLMFKDGTSNRGPIWCTHWPGMHRAEDIGLGETIGLLLDLEVGSLAVYRGGQRVGLMVATGLVAPLRWAVDLTGVCSVRIKSNPVPKVDAGRKQYEAAMLAEDKVHENDPVPVDPYTEETEYSPHWKTWTGDEAYGPDGEPYGLC